MSEHDLFVFLYYMLLIMGLALSVAALLWGADSWTRWQEDRAVISARSLRQSLTTIDRDRYSLPPEHHHHTGRRPVMNQRKAKRLRKAALLHQPQHKSILRRIIDTFAGVRWELR
jgi:hypothetical protein